MRICLINPNTTRSVTMKIGASAKLSLRGGIEISAVNPDFGPARIDGYFD